MKNKIQSTVGVVISLIAVVVFFQNCSKAFSTISRDDVLSDTSVFSESKGLNLELPDSSVKTLQSDADKNETPQGGDLRSKVCYLNGQSGDFIKSGETRNIVDQETYEPAQCPSPGAIRSKFQVSHLRLCDKSGKLVDQLPTKKQIGSERCAMDTLRCPAGTIEMNKQCQTINPGTLVFGGNYQCFSKYSGNQINNGVVASASEVILVVAKGKVDREYGGSADLIYQTRTAASGKSFKQDILDNKGYTSISVPANTADGDYILMFYDPTYDGSTAQQNTDTNLFQYYRTRQVARGLNYLEGYVTIKNGRLEDGSQLSGMTFVLDWFEDNSPVCEGHLSSPLVIDMRKEITKKTKGISLTSQIDGIFFNIMGLNATPEPDSKKHISWFHNPERFMLLSLPDSDGQVKGINELFGNNTKGPDGQFPENGYLALEKYDLNHDRIINKSDTVFSKLRLWGDLNKNGVSESNELFTLDEVGLVSIDLQFDSNYSEEDQYKNKTTMRSVVLFKNGAMRLIFDLWFKHNN